MKYDETKAMTDPTTDPPVTAPAVTAYTPRKAFPIEGSGLSHDEIGRAIANVATGAETAAARVIQAAEQRSNLNDYIDVEALAATLRDQAAAVQGGSLGQAESILINQATALQSLFARLVERGMGSDSIPGFETNLRMALRAQSQCRATLETLATIKNPPVVYARQANVTTGPQQVNNGVSNPPASRAREIEPELSGLLEEIDGQRLDTGTTSASGAADPHLATVGAVDGAENSRGQGPGRPECLHGQQAQPAPGAAQAAARAGTAPSRSRGSRAGELAPAVTAVRRLPGDDSRPVLHQRHNPINHHDTAVAACQLD